MDTATAKKPHASYLNVIISCGYSVVDDSGEGVGVFKAVLADGYSVWLAHEYRRESVTLHGEKNGGLCNLGLRSLVRGSDCHLKIN